MGDGDCVHGRSSNNVSYCDCGNGSSKQPGLPICLTHALVPAVGMMLQGYQFSVMHDTLWNKLTELLPQANMYMVNS